VTSALTTIFPAYFPDILTFRKIVRASAVFILDNRPVRSSGKWTRAAIKTADGKRHLSVPTIAPGSQHTPFREVQIDPEKPWRRKHRQSLYVNYKNAPYFEHYWPFLDEFFGQAFESYLALFHQALALILKLLHLKPHLLWASEISVTGTREDQVRVLLHREGIQTYILEASASRYFDCEKLRRADAACETVALPRHAYPQQFGGFVPNLSVLDVLFNLGPETIFYLKSE
jgi:hypothetical protein